MPQLSAGLLLYRRIAGTVEVLLGHPGGPFFRKKDKGAWTLPKGLVEEGEVGLAAARREFAEETGIETPAEGYIELGEVKFKSGKRVIAWAFEADCDPDSLESNTFELEWPPRSGKTALFPEIDRFGFFAVNEALEKLHEAQHPFLLRLLQALT